MTRRKQSNMKKLTEQIFKEGDMREKIEQEAGTSNVGVCRNSSAKNECTNVNKTFFEHGCVPYHRSQFSVTPNEVQISLLERCLSRVRNDPRCIGQRIYKGRMRKRYWLEDVEIEENDILEIIFDFIPPDEEYKKIQEIQDSECLRLTFHTQNQLFRSEYVDIRIVFVIEYDYVAQGITAHCRIFDDDAEDIMYDRMYTLDEMRTFTLNMITQPFIDIEVEDTTIRLKGNHKGQRIILTNVMYDFSGNVRLLNVQRF